MYECRFAQLQGDDLVNAINRLAPVIARIQTADTPHTVTECMNMAFEVSVCVLLIKELATLMQPELEDAWTLLLTHLASQQVDLITQRAVQLCAGHVGVAAIALGQEYVQQSMNAIVELKHIDDLMPGIQQFLSRMAGNQLCMKHRQRALKPLGSSVVSMLRQSGKLRGTLPFISGFSTASGVPPLSVGLFNLAIQLGVSTEDPSQLRQVEHSVLKLLDSKCTNPVRPSVAPPVLCITAWLQEAEVKAVVSLVLEEALVKTLEDKALVWLIMKHTQP